VLLAACGPVVDVPTRPAPQRDAAVKFVRPGDGTVVTSPVPIVLGVTGVVPGPCEPPRPCRWRLSVSVGGRCFREGTLIPAWSPDAAAQGIHAVADGSLRLNLPLPPGEHILCAQLRDADDVAFGAAATTVVRVVGPLVR